MTALVGYLLLFLVVGVVFVFFHLMLGKLIRPAKPDPEKLTIYECGEPTIGSSWIQFDLRFYVVALLFVIFDVEVAFFFPWAAVFGKANTLANAELPAQQRMEELRQLTPLYTEADRRQFEATKRLLQLDRKELQERKDKLVKESRALKLGAVLAPEKESELNSITNTLHTLDEVPGVAHQLAWLAFFDILFFFGVLLVGFAYLWKRGDLDWVRSTAAERIAAFPVPPPPREEPRALAGAGQH